MSKPKKTFKKAAADAFVIGDDSSGPKKSRTKKGKGGRPSEGKGDRVAQTYRVEPETIEALKFAALKAKKSISDMVNEAIAQYLEGLDS